MAFGGNPTISLLAYTTVKLAGYSFFGKKLNQWYNKTRPRPIVFGAARTLLGIVVGIGSLFLLSGLTSNREALFLILLIPIRFFEWFLMLYLFFERNNFSIKRISRFSTQGIFFSFALDIPVIFSVFVIPGGVWIC
jgi:hypothetical protein